MEQPKGKDLQKELDIALSELEERVDRLRALYEQYFMGYEKMEPSVQRKDVERRFTVLRKQQIRNTASRFRLNVVSQKYNTYSMYWGRICRQIEEGTYKRHVAKAARRFGGGNELEGAREREREHSIDIELGELDDADLDAVLAEADAAAEAHARAPAPSKPTLERPVTPTAEIPLGNRVARPVALPPGTKQPLLRRQPTPQSFDPAGIPPSSHPNPRPPASSPAPSPASAPGGRIPVPPASRPNVQPQAQPSSARIPAEVPRSQPRPYQPATAISVGRQAIASRAPDQPSTNRVPAAAPAPAGSTNRILVARPATPATAATPDQTTPRAPSANGVPAAPPAANRAPQPYRPVALPPGSVNRIPARGAIPGPAAPGAGRIPVAKPVPPDGPESEPSGPRPNQVKKP